MDSLDGGFRGVFYYRHLGHQVLSQFSQKSFVPGLRSVPDYFVWTLLFIRSLTSAPAE